MNFDAELKKIESLNRCSLKAYEKQIDLMLTDAKAKIQEAKLEENRSISTSGKIDLRTLKIINAMENEKKILTLKRALNKRKSELMTPAERKQLKAKKAQLFARLQALQL